MHRSEWITADGGVAWAADDRVLALGPVNLSVSPARQPMAMEDPALEDFAGSVRFNARLTKPGEDSGPFGTSASTIEVRSGQTLPLAGARTPLSRGMACAGFGNPCPLTDGDLTPIDAGMQVFSFTFPTPARVSAVVVRGVETESSLMFVLLEQPDGGPRRVVQYALPTSLWNAGVPSFVLKPQPDGGFQFSPKSDPRFFVVAFDAGAPVSAVTVGFVDDVDRISEISLFE